MPNEPGLTTSVAPGSNLLAHAAALMVARERPPNLSDTVVIVPSLFVVQPFQSALQRAANGSALQLPTITTLPLWAATIAVPRAPLPDSRRLTWVHSALRSGNWFPGLDLWQVAAEILTLIDECASHSIALPRDAGDFQRLVRQALRASDNHAIQFEARLVHEIWRALQGDGAELDRHGAYRLRLAELASRAASPLYAVGLLETSTAEHQFLQRYAQHQPVQVIHDDAAQSAAQSPLFALLQSAWTDSQVAPVLQTRALQFSRLQNASPAASLRAFAAKSLEQEAHAIELTIRRWLYDGKRAIAIIAQDRLTARRARARLERAQILIADESGWTLSTTTASSVVMRWLDVVGGDFYFRDLLDFIHSPFVRSATNSDFENRLREANFINGLTMLRAIFERAALPAAEAQFARALTGAGAHVGRTPRTLARWVRVLLECFERMDITAALSRDAAGNDLLHLLQNLAIELEGESERYSMSEWRRWLDRQLEGASFRDSAIESSVVLTHLGLTDGRRFDGVILLGADSDHLPSPGNHTLFNDAVQAQLGLPSRESRHDLERRRLMNILAYADAALITWQGTKGNEPNPPSSYWARLAAFHQVAYGEDLQDRDLVRRLEDVQAGVDEVIGVKTMPRPSAPQLVPQTLSASDYSSLIGCPYQFFVRRMLALREQDEVLEALEKRDYGELVHRILAEFHQHFPVTVVADDVTLIAALQEISGRVFSTAPAGDYFSRAWYLRWERFIPAYVTWQRERESLGWRWQASEVVREAPLEFAVDRMMRLRGRFDRIDRRHDDYAVLDYKTGSAKSLKERAGNPDEDGQLPFYAMLAETMPRELAYVGLDSDPLSSFTMAGDVAEISAGHRQRLQQTLSAIAAGQGLPAQGVERVCEYCEARGICRKTHWRDAQGV